VKRCVVTGAGGFIGGHLVQRLLYEGAYVTAVDVKPLVEWWQVCGAAVNARTDLSTADGAGHADEVYHLAANMGGIGWIEGHRADICAENTRIDINVLEMARAAKVGRLLYTSSACVYPAELQGEVGQPLAEWHADGRHPEPGYGEQKLYTERLCHYYREDYGLETRVARLHNVYGPRGSWTGGREKSPAAICRKVAEVKDGGEIEVWGDGEQTRSYCYVDDVVDGLVRLMRSDYPGPVNVGSDRLVSINELVRMVSAAAGKRVDVRHVPGPLGVRGRNADLTLATQVLGGWRPEVSLEQGLAQTYDWIRMQVRRGHP